MVAMKADALSSLFAARDTAGKMPAVFLGHGSPMNAIEENEFVQGFRQLSSGMEKPDAILCISAHWETKGTFVMADKHPSIIYDFGGFPPELYTVKYPAHGNPALARETKQLITTANVELDWERGLDHGAWSVVKHLYPDASVPVVQMSIDYTKPAAYHYELAQQLKALRRKNILIVGSGNMVHNLRMVDWSRLNESFAYDWAEEAGTAMKKFIMDRDHDSLIGFRSGGKAFDLAVPTPEHYLPLLYVLALQDKDDEVSLFNDKPVAGALTMTSVKIG